MGSLITVGGLVQDETAITGDVYRFNEQSQKWEEFLKPLPTPRYYLSAAATQSAIVTSGGLQLRVKCLYPLLLWRCTAAKSLSGTLLTPYLYLVGA